MKFLSDYWHYFKRLWTTGWFYLLLVILWIGGEQVILKKSILSVVLALIFPLLAMARQWLEYKYGQNDKNKGA